MILDQMASISHIGADIRYRASPPELDFLILAPSLKPIKNLSNLYENLWFWIRWLQYPTSGPISDIGHRPAFGTPVPISGPISGVAQISGHILELLSRVISFSWFSMLFLKSNSVTKPIKQILEVTMHMKVFPITGKCYVWPSCCCRPKAWTLMLQPLALMGKAQWKHMKISNM